MKSLSSWLLKISKIIDFEQKLTRYGKTKKEFQARPLKPPNPLCLAPPLGRKFLFTSDPPPHTLFGWCPKFCGFFYGFPKRSCTYLDRYFGTNNRHCSQSTGNDVSGPLFSPFFFRFPFPNLFSKSHLKCPIPYPGWYSIRFSLSHNLGGGIWSTNQFYTS